MISLSFTRYFSCLKKVSYLVINVSSPNTQGLRGWQEKDRLKEVLTSIKSLNKNIPLFVKISPDILKECLYDVICLAQDYNLAGLIATNTTQVPQGGGVSGRDLFEKSKKTRNDIFEILSKDEKKLDIIGVGGFEFFDDILDFWRQGGRLVQFYSSFIYKGPYFHL